MPGRHQTGQAAQRRGLEAEAAACAALAADGWAVLARRLRTPAGEIDILAQRAGLLAIIEVKARPRLDTAAAALGPRQRARLIAAAELVLASDPTLGPAGVRFDVIVVDGVGRVRRIADAFRQDEP